MKSSAARFELLSVAAVLMAAMLVVMRVQRPAAGCARLPEGHRILLLSRDIDREHLASDLASAARIASRQAESITDPAQRNAALANCETDLRQQIATTHGLSPDDLRTRGIGAP